MVFQWQLGQATALPILGVFLVGVLAGALIALLVFKT